MKKGEMKRSQILDAAEKVFLERGYDHTSVQDLLDVLGMSKGGFYHYFDAKETVLRAVSERRTLARVGRAMPEIRDPRRRPADRLNLLLRQTVLMETEEPAFAGVLLRLCYLQKDPAMLAQRRRILTEQLLSAMGEVLEAGMKDDSFFLRHPQETGRILLMLAFDVDEAVTGMVAEEPENPDRLIPAIELLNAYREAAETLVGAPHGTLEFFDIGQLVLRCREALDAMSEEGKA